MKKLDFLGRAGTVIIAEVGSNHTGDAGLAREAVAAAKEAGADIVKFQMYKDRKSTRLNSSHVSESRMPSSA